MRIYTKLAMHGKEQDMPLEQRRYSCDCGLDIDRDLNAAINIRTFAVSSTGSKKPAVKKSMESRKTV